MHILRTSGNNTTSIIDIANDTVTATVPVGTTPWGVGVSPDGSKVYVANYDSNNISVIDTSNNTVIDTVHVGINPSGVAVNPNGTKVYVANYGSSNISVIDTSNNTVTATVHVGIYPAGVAVNPRGTRVYVASSDIKNVNYNSTLFVIDTCYKYYYSHGKGRKWSCGSCSHSGWNKGICGELV